MPEQCIHSSKKTPEWGRKCVLAIKSMSTSVDDMGRTSRENKEENYDLVNSIFREENFDYVLNPFGLNMKKYGGTPTKMQNYNIIRSRLETLRGEEMNSPLNFFVYAIAGEAVSAKKTMRRNMLKDLMKAHIRMEFGLDEQITALEEEMNQLSQQISGVQDQAALQKMQQQMQALTDQRNNMPDIQAEMQKFNSVYVDPTEQTNNKILKFLKRKDKLALKFNMGWYHALVAAEEVYYTGIVRGHPSVRPVNPLQLDYDKGANTTFIHEGNWVREEFWLPIGEVLELYGDVLTKEQAKKISSGNAGHSYMQNGMQQGFAYSFDGGQRVSQLHRGASSHVYVMTCCWRGTMQVGILKYRDPRSGKMEQVEVDDTFTMTPELKALGATIDWQYDSEIWEGTLIGDDIFVNVQPKANQTKNLPYIGYVYNNVNSIATSMVDLAKSHQYTYIICWWRLEQELAKAKGRKFVMDMAQLPKSMGWDVDQWMYYFENLGVVWINSREEGRKGDPTSVAQFNQFQSIDMSLSQVVGQYMQVINKLEAMVEDIMGVSPQRMGGIEASETATGAQTAISRSTNVTRPWFYFHDMVKEEVLTELLELAKIAYIDGTEMEVILDEGEIATLKVDGDKLNASQMGVFVTNSYQERENKEKMENLLVSAVQQGKARLIDVANVLDSDSMSYIKSTLDAAEKQAQEAAQASNNANIEAQNAKAEQDRQDKELDRAHEKELEAMGIEKDILLKKMELGVNAGMMAGSGDPLADIKAAESIHKATIEERKLELENRKESNRAAEKSKELTIKEKEVQLKKQQNGSKGKN